MTKPIVPIRSSTQQFTEIEDIDHDMILFTDGSCAIVIATTAVNYGLLSDAEQGAMVRAYAGFLNSLSFPIEIIVRSQHKDVSSYLVSLEEHEKQEINPGLAKSIHNYRLFVAATVKEKEVLDKKFYIVVPFSRLEIGSSPAILFGQTNKQLPYPKEYIFERALTKLTPKADHVLRLLGRIGLRGKQLTTDQLIRYFFLSYNPDSPSATTDNAPSAITKQGDDIL